jgi:hypothetical protein
MPSRLVVEGDSVRIVEVPPRQARPAAALAVAEGNAYRGRLLIPLAIVTLVLARPAWAQLLVGEDDPSEPIWAVDVVTNQATPVLSGFGAVAMAVDGNTNTLYFMTNTVTLYKWDLDTPLTPPTLVGTTVNTAGQNLSLTGLAFDNATNKLYAARTLDSSSGPEGFYEVNPASGVSTLKFGVTATSFDFGGFDYNPQTGNFYANNDVGATGIYRVDFANNNVNFVAPYPQTSDNPPDIDGLAVGGGKIYMVEDRAVQTGGKVYVYNIATGAYEPVLQTPWFFNETFAGATYIPNFADFMANIPEPTGAVAFVMIGIAALSRRRAFGTSLRMASRSSRSRS